MKSRCRISVRKYIAKNIRYFFKEVIEDLSDILIDIVLTFKPIEAKWTTMHARERLPCFRMKLTKTDILIY